MKITILFFATLRDKFGKEKTVKLNRNSTRLIEVISKVDGLKEEIVEGGSIKKMYKILVNGINVEFLDKLDTLVRDGDEICIFPPAGGG
ncbi:MAG: molybdopterin synthase sulfur carrier subunit [Thermofilum sp. ex4484_79]|nr:MAG: molybdopterin synthase sulfur carrier subunit [Thermofilum sp. ex4484_79]HDD64287.1 MoaD/ThiS family protein [Thermoprotei archaeon]